MEGNFERRESQTDLEIGRQHMMELFQQVLPLVKFDQVQNQKCLELMEDLKKTTQASEIKKIADEASKFGIPPYNLRAEDRVVMRKILEEMSKTSEKI